jgi:hypothetical protein
LRGKNREETEPNKIIYPGSISLGFCCSHHPGSDLLTIIFSIAAAVLLWRSIQALHPEYKISGVRPHLMDDVLYAIGFIILTLAIIAGLIALTQSR